MLNVKSSGVNRLRNFVKKFEEHKSSIHGKILYYKLCEVKVDSDC